MAKENSDGQEKTEEPTGKRKSKARDEGQVAKSTEINFVTGLLAAIIYFVLNGTSMIMSLKHMLQSLLSNLSIELTDVSVVKIAQDLLNSILEITLPFMIVLVVVAILSNVFQIGLIFTAKPLKPKLSKFNTIKGLKKKFSIKCSITILKALLKIMIIAIVPIIVIRGELEHLPLIMDMNTWGVMCYMGSIIIRIVFYIALVMTILAIIDLIYEKWKNKNELKMTKQEVKDEHKQAEGDPKVKARIRQLQMKIALQRMMDDVPKADVVVANPVHLAVALKYDRGSMGAPKVIAKGARLIAEKIKKIAREHNIPVIENKPLAQSLFKMVEVGDIIPDALYKAVAEILAYVYSRKSRAAAG